MQSLSENGIAHAPLGPRAVLAVAGQGHDIGREPLDAVLAMGRDASRIVFYAVLGAVLFHGAIIARAEIIPIELMNWSRNIGREVHYRLYETYEIDLLKPAEAPPPPPKEEPEPVKEQPKEAPPPPSAVKDLAPPAAPAAARAGAVLTAPEDPDAPANFDGFISGSAETFAGGNSSAAGTSNTAVRGRAVAVGGVPGGTGSAPTGPAAVDHSRIAGVSGSKDWNCPFPPEADSEQIDQAFPTIQVAVRPDGTPERVTVLSDPGHGFGRAATRCAMQQRYETALDSDGKPIAGLTKSLRVHFER
jgi:protein TonB